MAFGFGDLEQPVVQRLDRVRGVDDPSDCGVEAEERGEPFPVASPQVHDRGIPFAPFDFEGVQRVRGAREGGGVGGVKIGFSAATTALRSFQVTYLIEFRIRWVLCRRRHNG